MVAIYSDIKSERLQFVLELVFDEILKCGHEVYHHRDAFIACDLPKVVYGREAMDDDVLIIPDSGLLGEKGIRQQSFDTVQWKSFNMLFPSKVASAVFPFDPFSMIFYLVSRYEEYLADSMKDRHGRFQAKNSILSRLNMLNRPIVDILAKEIKTRIGERYPAYKFPPVNYSFQPSYDIDMAFAHLGKSFLRTIGGFARLFMKLQAREIRGRVKTLLGLEQDPFDNFDLQEELHRDLGLKPLYFVNLGDYSRFDKNVSYRSKRLQDLLVKLSSRSELGIHPSYYSDVDFDVLKKEKERLEEITGKPVKKSRQHFLKMEFPGTYRKLIRLGIEDDHSMGYASQTGYRAGISSPFYFYDLKEEKKTLLRIHPFAFMDTVFLDYLGARPAEIPGMAEPLLTEAKELEIPLAAIWHNYALADDKERIDAYKSILNKAVEIK
ncbi:MAG: polysaccharide deacetylase family protein [Bacteroidota bacterium]|nr:polysaccharide deacetylase family protein [Bacteroidota bacterium]